MDNAEISIFLLQERKSANQALRDLNMFRTKDGQVMSYKERQRVGKSGS